MEGGGREGLGGREGWREAVKHACVRLVCTCTTAFINKNRRHMYSQK